MKKKYLVTVTLMVTFFMLPLFGITALAEPYEIEEVAEVIEYDEFTYEHPYDLEPLEPVEVTFEIPVTSFPQEPPRPFTPPGTGTVVDHATNEDGKEFFTIVTPNENIFYLVIDRQRSHKNVYFLNAVTEADLMALAQIPERPEPPPTIIEPPDSTTEPETPPVTAAPEQTDNSNVGLIALIVAVAVVGGAAGWYFKIYRPKQQSPSGEDEYIPNIDDIDSGYLDDWDEDYQDQLDGITTLDEDDDEGDNELLS